MNNSYNQQEMIGAYPTHPGTLIKEELECRGISQKSFASKIGLSYSVLNEILNEKRSLNTRAAFLISAALKINAGLLLRMQTQYDMELASKDAWLNKRMAEIRKICAVL